MLGVHDYILFLFLIIAFISDIKNQKLPNWLTAGGIVVGIIY
ncbi:prepilin peptidase, partial [Paenibacillus sp. 7884-2]